MNERNLTSIDFSYLCWSVCVCACLALWWAGEERGRGVTFLGPPRDDVCLAPPNAANFSILGKKDLPNNALPNA